MNTGNDRPGFAVSSLVWLWTPPVGPILLCSGVIWLFIFGDWWWAITLFVVGSAITVIVTGVNNRINADPAEAGFSSPPLTKSSPSDGASSSRGPVPSYAKARSTMLWMINDCRVTLIPYAGHPTAAALLQRITQYCTALQRPDFFSHPLDETLAVGHSILADQQQLISALTMRGSDPR